MAKFASHNSTYNGDGNRQKGASIFFSGNFWSENENLYKSDNGDLIISRLKNNNLSLIIANVYAPNDHNVNYFNQLKDLVLDIQTDHPTYSVIIMGDFNITLEARDGINRNASQEEINARTITNEIMHDVNLL